MPTAQTPTASDPYPLNCISREGVDTDDRLIQSIELVSVTLATPRRLNYIYVVQDVETQYGVLDIDYVGGPHTSRGYVNWFDTATSVESCVMQFAAWLKEQQSDIEKETEDGSR